MVVMNSCGALSYCQVRRIIRLGVSAEARNSTGVDENLTYIKAGWGWDPVRCVPRLSRKWRTEVTADVFLKFYPLGWCFRARLRARLFLSPTPPRLESDAPFRRFWCTKAARRLQLLPRWFCDLIRKSLCFSWVQGSPKDALLRPAGRFAGDVFPRVKA